MSVVDHHVRCAEQFEAEARRRPDQAEGLRAAARFHRQAAEMLAAVPPCEGDPPGTVRWV